VPLLSDFDGAIVGAGAGTAADQEDLLDPLVTRTREHLLAVGVEFAPLEVSVAIYVHELGL
jgi:hypothetical protein